MRASLPLSDKIGRIEEQHVLEIDVPISARAAALVNAPPETVLAQAEYAAEFTMPANNQKKKANCHWQIYNRKKPVEKKKKGCKQAKPARFCVFCAPPTHARTQWEPLVALRRLDPATCEFQRIGTSQRPRYFFKLLESVRTCKPPRRQENGGKKGVIHKC